MFAKNALAAVALLAAVTAQAESINVYGNVDVAVGSFEDDLTHRITKVESGVLNGSFLGIKGQEDLGGGLKAFFKLESSIGVDTGAAGGSTSVGSGFWDRTSEVGLAGSFGTLTAGNSVSLSARANNAQSPFSVYGRLNGLQGAINDTFSAFQANTVTATSATYQGLSAAAQFGASEAHGQNNTYAVQGNYAAGPLAAGLTYTNDDKTNNKLTQLGGSYDFGVAKAFAQIGRANLASQDNISYFGLGVAAPVSGAGTVLASWTHAKMDNVGKYDELSVAYDHALSKRTGVYGGVQYVNAKAEGADSHSGVSVMAGLHHAF